MKYQNGLRASGIVILEKYPEWLVLITDLKSYENDVECLKGLAFNKNGKFETPVELRLPLNYKEVDYLDCYKSENTILKLNLISKKLPITKEDILDSDLEQTILDQLEKRVADIEFYLTYGFDLVNKGD